MSEPQAIRCTVHYSGRVQGVGFRFTTVQLAENFCVAGYVQNLPDGGVRLVAEGAPQEVRGLLEAVARRMGANIREQKVDQTPANGEFGKAEPGALSVRY